MCTHRPQLRRTFHSWFTAYTSLRLLITSITDSRPDHVGIIKTHVTMPVLMGKVCGGPGPAVMLISARVEPQPAVGVLRACGSESTASWHAVSHILDVHARSFPLLRLTSRLPCRMCKDNRHVNIALIRGLANKAQDLLGTVIPGHAIWNQGTLLSGSGPAY